MVVVQLEESATVAVVSPAATKKRKKSPERMTGLCHARRAPGESVDSLRQRPAAASTCASA